MKHGGECVTFRNGEGLPCYHPQATSPQATYPPPTQEKKRTQPPARTRAHTPRTAAPRRGARAVRSPVASSAPGPTPSDPPPPSLPAAPSHSHHHHHQHQQQQHQHQQQPPPPPPPPPLAAAAAGSGVARSRRARPPGCGRTTRGLCSVWWMEVVVFVLWVGHGWCGVVWSGVRLVGR
jgi:hypothetical protein